MIYRFLFYFSSYLEKKYDVLRTSDPYISSYIIVGFTIAVNIFVIFQIAWCLFIKNIIVMEIAYKLMYVLIIAMIIFSYLHFKNENRRDEIYNEIHQYSAKWKFKYGLYCLLYLVISYGSWFICNDIVCVLRNGYGNRYATEIVNMLNLTLH